MNGVVVGSDGTLYGTTSGIQPTIFALHIGGAFRNFAPSPTINSNGLVNAASYTAPLVPGSLATAFGNFLLPSAVGNYDLPWPTALSQLSLRFSAGGAAYDAPLSYVSDTQLDFQVPWELTNASQATVTATLNIASPAQLVRIAAAAPAIFTTNSSGTGQGAILDTSYRLVDTANPAAPGDYVSIYCTGLGPVTHQPASGASASTGVLSASATPIVTIGSADALVQFSGLAPGYVGLYQVNAQVPAASLTGAAVPVVITIGQAVSNTVSMAVR